MQPTVQDPQAKFLAQLAREYPTVAAASSEIINLQAILRLPKSTEHFMSDLHGEADAFTHILSNASGVIREKIDRVLADELSDAERAEFATLIYYPAQKLARLKPLQDDPPAWYRQTLYRLIEVFRMIASKHTRSFVRKCLPEGFAYILDELLHAHFEDHDKELYYGSIVDSIIDVGRADDFIIALAQLIRRMAVFRLHIVGDIFDRGARPDVILDELMRHHAVDIQWGNHDVEWMGAAAGSDVCVASVIHVTLAYNNLETLEDGYGISLRPLSQFAEEVYRDTDVSGFWPKLTEGGEYSPADLARTARMHKAIAVMLFKAECALIDRNPDFGMQDRALLRRVDFVSQTIRIGGVEYHMKDCDFPTVDAADPAAMTPGERDVLDKLCQSFTQSDKLARHVRFLYAKGSVYHIENNNLLFHGAVPLDEAGCLAEAEYGGRRYAGRAWMDKCERMARQGYFAPTSSEARRRGQDCLYYRWCGPLSPIFGRDRMATFEHLFVDGEFPERKNPYYLYIENEDEAIALRTAKLIFDEFGLDFGSGHIVNGHIPVRASSGEQPVKAGGKLIVIDGGFCKAYHSRTGIAGYTLVSSSRGLSLRSHGPFESTQKAIAENLDILSAKDMFEPSGKRIYVADTDEGAQMKERIADLKRLLAAYADGSLKEQA